MKNIPFLFLLALCLCLCACSAPVESADIPAAQPELIELTVYHGDDNCEYILSDTVLIPELSPDYIMEALHTQAVLTEKVAVNSFLMDKTGVIRLDLAANFATQINAMGTSGEYIMLGSLVNTFLDAYDASGLILQVEGNTLETGHSIYDWTLEHFE